MTRRKTEAAGPDKSVAGGAAGDMTAELAELRHTVDQLQQGLVQMLDTQATHTEMLRAVLTATTTETEPEHQLGELLESIVLRLQSQSEQLARMGERLTALPDDVGKAVARELASALAAVR